ncbi:MAG: FHA domain-containing protein, partial [Actinomycetes bacterium]
MHGATVGLGVTAERDTPGPGHYLVVVAGPDTGRWTLLRPGAAVVVGRSVQCDLALSDSLLSGRHLRVHLSSDGALVAEDLGSTNGTLLEGKALDGSKSLAPGEYLQVGTSILTACEVTEADRAPDRAPDGASMPFQRHFREAAEPLPGSLRAPRPPIGASSSIGTSWLRSVAPLLGGLAFAVISGRWIFLLIVAISPIVFIVDNLRRKRATERKEAEENARYEQALDDLAARYRQLTQAELLRRRAQANPGGLAGLFGLVRHRRIWERSPNDADFGAVTVGLAEGRSDVKVEGDLPEERELSPHLWCSPLVHSLVSDGPLSIVGPTSRARAAARAMVLELCSAHSPADVKLWVLTDEDAAADWEAIRWLPHAFSDEHSARVAANARTRAALLSDLQRVVANRSTRVRTPDAVVLPVHVLVVDGTELVAPEDLTEILAHGPAVGVTGITVDEREVPEGTTGRIGVGAYADVASFSSRRQPATTDVITFEISAAQAEATARRLAGLRPVSGAGQGAPAGSTRLRTLLDVDNLDGAALAARWERSSPTTSTLVGLDAGVPVYVDLAKDGPHG